MNQGNPFSGLISTEFKALYDNAIDSLLEQGALTVKCKLKYSGNLKNFCNNCRFDPITKLSANIYNGTGPRPFIENTICPVCMGMGVSDSNAEEYLDLAVIFDSRYFLNYPNKVVNVVDGTIQTICHITLMPKIRNANEIIIDTNIEKYGGYSYRRAGDPNPCGLGSNRYIFTMWSRS